MDAMTPEATDTATEPAALLTDLRRRGVGVWCWGGKARWSARGTDMGVADVIAVKANQRALADLLARESRVAGEG